LARVSDAPPLQAATAIVEAAEFRDDLPVDVAHIAGHRIHVSAILVAGLFDAREQALAGVRTLLHRFVPGIHHPPIERI